MSVPRAWLACALLLSTGVAAQSAAPSWAELGARSDPQWFRDAKLGIFIHWGVYSVPSVAESEQYGEWFFRGLQAGDTLRTRVMREWYGADATYYDLAPLFRAELFDPSEWATLFRRSGAGYVVLVSKHHDGYALWPSRFAPGWNSADVGPGRDIVGELTDAVRPTGLRMGLYYSLAEWTHPLHRWYRDPPDAIGPYVEQHMIPQLKELVTAYRPSVLFVDGEWLNTAEQWHARELIGWYYDTVGDEAIVNDRWGAGSDVGFRTPEYSAGIAETERPWTEVRGLGRSFGLNRREPLEAYMTPDELVRFFVGTVADGGGMILNVGPGADGQIPLLQQERLRQLGEWLAVNGDAVYGSRPWVRTGEWHDVVVERVDPAIDFDWVRNAPDRNIPEDQFTAEWVGYLRPRYSDRYELEVVADDGARVWVADTLVIDAWAGGTEETATGAVTLAADVGVPLRVTYREGTQNASVRLYWSSEHQVREIVPSVRLRTPADEPGLRATYRGQQRHIAYTTRDGNLYAVTFGWPEGELALPIPQPAAGCRVRLLGSVAEVASRYADDTLYVDLSGIPYRDIPGAWAWTIALEGYDAAR